MNNYRLGTDTVLCSLYFKYCIHTVLEGPAEETSAMDGPRREDTEKIVDDPVTSVS